MSQILNTCKDKFNVLFLPDIHTGHPRIRPDMLHSHLIEYVYPKLPDTDLLVIGGDFFHTLLNMNSEAGIMAATIIDELISMAKMNEFYIRVVRGTFSHDRFQNRFFTIRDNGKNVLWDRPMVRVLDNIEIEIFPKWDLKLLYCPDDQPTTELSETLLECLNSQGIEQVDFLCSHGYFEHLLPSNMDHIPNNTIHWDTLKNRVSGCVLNGHVHFHCIRNRVVSGGSFERFVHGEEEDKGYYIIEYSLKDRKVMKYNFIKNEKATPFITINAGEYSCVEECFKYVDDLIERIRTEEFKDNDQEIHLCIVGENSILANYIKSTYHNVFVKHKSKIVNKVLDVDVDTSYNDLPKITKQNLPELVWGRIQPKITDALDKDILTLEEVERILNE